MKTSVIAAFLGMLIGGLAVAIVFSSSGQPAAPATQPPPATAQAKPTALFTDAASPPPAPATVSTAQPLPAAVAPPPSLPPDPAHEQMVQERTAHLMALARNDDADSRQAIWTELFNPDKAIRSAALDALVQFGDRSVAPQLRQLAAQSQDPDEKQHILMTADELELPRLEELPSAPNR